MKIRLSQLGAQQPKAFPQPPRNYGYARHAQQELDQIISSANAQYEEAMKVDGVPFLLFRKTYEGRPCTCSIPPTVTVNSDPRHEISPANDKTTRSDPGEIRVRGSWDLHETQQNVEGQELGVQIGKLEQDRGNAATDIRSFPKVDVDEEDIDSWFDNPAETGFVAGGPAVACGICLGTRHTNGYSLFHGVREVFECTNYDAADIFTIDDATRPYSFVSPTGVNAFVQWVYELPTYFLDAVSLSIRNNINQAEGLRVEYKLQGTADAFAPLTTDFLRSRRGIPTVIVMRVAQMPSRKSDRELRFTHIELVFQLAAWPLTQIPQQSIPSTFETVEPKLETEFPLPPSIDKVGPDDAIYDLKYNMVWKINNVTDWMTSRRQILGWSASALSQTRLDLLSLLKIIRVPTYNIAYKGLESMPGSEDFGDDKI